MNILHDADKLTAAGGERRSDYGDCRQAQEKAAAMWSVILGTPVTGAQVALCMIALKLTREIQSPKRDNVVDIAGWARVYELTTEKEQTCQTIEEDRHSDYVTQSLTYQDY